MVDFRKHGHILIILRSCYQKNVLLCDSVCMCMLAFVCVCMRICAYLLLLTSVTIQYESKKRFQFGSVSFNEPFVLV